MSATATKERPILFSGEMVRAILAGTKTQTRRIVGHLPNDGGTCYVEQTDGTWWPYRSIDGDSLDDGNGCEVPRNCPYGIPGDRLWVRETWGVSLHEDADGDFAGATVTYPADGQSQRFGDESIPAEWTMPTAAKRGSIPSIHMPRWASRINLEITGVRVGRLQDISEGDAVAEGVASWSDPVSGVEEFQILWESINGPGSWDANPFVWVVEFKRETGE